MFDEKDLKVGSIFYRVNETNLAFSRKKIHMELDGVDWFRYDRPLRTYEIVKYEVLGILTKKLEGEWETEFELNTEFYVKNCSTMKCYTIDLSDDSYMFFVDIEAAMDYKETMELEAKELDKT